MTLDMSTGEVISPFIRSPFNYDMAAVSLQTALVCEDETRTQQQFKEECDINTIVEKFGVTGEMPTGVSIPFNADFTEVWDYRSALHLMREADEAFMKYPAEVRARFQNDPSEFVDFVSDPKNVDEVKKMGLGRAETPRPAPIEVRVIAEPSGEQKIAPAASGAT